MPLGERLYAVVTTNPIQKSLTLLTLIEINGTSTIGWVFEFYSLTN